MAFSFWQLTVCFLEKVGIPCFEVLFRVLSHIFQIYTKSVCVNPRNLREKCHRDPYVKVKSNLRSNCA